MKKIFVLFFGLFYFSSIVAEICPTVDAIQHHELAGWQAYNSDDGEPLSPEQFASYQANLYSFAEADYFEGAPEGAAQCYYTSRSDPYYGYAYLAKQALQPDFKNSPWQWRDVYNAVCQEKDLAACKFIYIGVA